MKHEVLYVGTHRRAHHADPIDIAFGIYSFQKDPGNAQLNFIEVTECPQPGWIAVHPSGRFLYVVNEVANFEGEAGGGVTTFAVNPETGSLSPLNTKRTPSLPCHCEIDATGRYLLVASFGGGTVHLFPIMSDGRLAPEADSHRHTGSSVHPRRQTHPHAHAVAIDPANRFVLVPDLGTDRIIVYELAQESGKLIPQPEREVRLSPGSGPRHLTFDATGRFAYLMNEMSATVTAFSYDSGRGALQATQTVDLLSDGFTGLRSGAGNWDSSSRSISLCFNAQPWIEW